MLPPFAKMSGGPYRIRATLWKFRCGLLLLSVSWRSLWRPLVSPRWFKKNGSPYSWCCTILHVNIGRWTSRISTSILWECKHWYKKRMEQNSSAQKTTLPLWSYSSLDHAHLPSRHLLHCSTGLHGLRITSRLFWAWALPSKALFWHRGLWFHLYLLQAQRCEQVVTSPSL